MPARRHAERGSGRAARGRGARSVSAPECRQPGGAAPADPELGGGPDTQAARRGAPIQHVLSRRRPSCRGPPADQDAAAEAVGRPVGPTDGPGRRRAPGGHVLHLSPVATRTSARPEQPNSCSPSQAAAAFVGHAPARRGSRSCGSSAGTHARHRQAAAAAPAAPLRPPPLQLRRQRRRLPVARRVRRYIAASVVRAAPADQRTTRAEARRARARADFHQAYGAPLCRRPAPRAPPWDL